MSSLHSSAAPRWLSDEEAPMADSFARTLRAFAEQKRAEARPRSSPATPITQPRPLRPLGPLQQGPEKAPAGKTPGAKIGQAPPATTARPQETEAEDAVAQPAKKAVAHKAPRPRKTPLLTRAWGWLQKRSAFSAKKQLRVCEMVSLGEKRFVAVVQIQEQKFLIGGGSSGVSLLAELDGETEPDLGAALENEESPSEGEELSRILASIASAGGRLR